jgi:hypothetical protein
MRSFKSSKFTLSVLIAAAAVAGGAAQVAAVEGVISSTPSTAVEYCHSKFPAIRPSTLATPYPELKQAGTGDVVDYYGPCDHDPLGKDEAAEQEHQDEERQARDYGD